MDLVMEMDLPSPSPQLGTTARGAGYREAVPEPSWVKVMNYLPLKNSMEAIGMYSQFVADTITHDKYDDFWKAMSIQEKYADMDVPAFHLTGWYDDLTHETIANFVNMRKLSKSDNARRWQKLLIGPWGHGVRSDPKYGDMDFGP
jgi:predicted acyl esterase